MRRTSTTSSGRGGKNSLRNAADERRLQHFLMMFTLRLYITSAAVANASSPSAPFSVADATSVSIRLKLSDRRCISIALLTAGSMSDYLTFPVKSPC